MRVLLGVSAGIAAYKSAEIVRAFVKRSDEVRAVMTEGAREFIAPMTLQVLSDNPVGTEVFDPGYEEEIGHIELARWADVLLVAPATADVIARMAHGMGDDLLTTVVLATEAPVVVAPAMNTKMWQHSLVQRNVATLRDEGGYRVVDPDAGELACKEVGPGRMPDPPVLVDEVEAAVADSFLAGERVVVTAGPTREAIDPARFLSNPSSGKMGYALARTARRFGAEVTLISGPTGLQPPMGVHRVEVTSTAEMREAVLERADEASIVCKAAAVADWRPTEASREKLKKESWSGELRLERTTDILAELGDRFGDASAGPYLIGFAAESEEVEAGARRKLEEKGVDMIVGNEIGGAESTFGSETIRAHVVTSEGSMPYGPVSKEDFAEKVWRRVADERAVI